MSLSRRSSQQYSLFPTCSPLPVAQPLAPGKRDDSVRDQTRSWSISSATEGQAGHVLARPEPKETQQHTTEGKRRSTDLTILKVIKKLKRQSTAMSRLIPLKLEAVAVTTRMPSQSTTALPIVKTIASPSTSPIYPPKRPEIPSRTSSIQKERSGPATSLTILPYTQEEWAKVMEEVKDLYSKGHYKHCASRCKQMLKSIKDPVSQVHITKSKRSPSSNMIQYRVHPLYSIYLSFFAASALEITASSLHTNSNTKLPLYQEALSFYQRAESFIEYATLRTDPNVIHTSARQSSAHSLGQGGIDHQMIHHSSNSSMSSTNSIHSSVDSIFSRRSSSACSIASTMSPLSEYEPSCHLRRSSSISSRASSESFLPSQQRPKKKVSFSSQLPAMSSENDMSAMTISAALLDSFPEPPSESRTRSSSPHKTSYHQSHAPAQH
jgi:hypothetical protein